MTPAPVRRGGGAGRVALRGLVPDLVRCGAGGPGVCGAVLVGAVGGAQTLRIVAGVGEKAVRGGVGMGAFEVVVFAEAGHAV